MEQSDNATTAQCSRKRKPAVAHCLCIAMLGISSKPRILTATVGQSSASVLCSKSAMQRYPRRTYVITIGTRRCERLDDVAMQPLAVGISLVKTSLNEPDMLSIWKRSSLRIGSRHRPYPGDSVRRASPLGLCKALINSPPAPVDT